MKKTIWNQIDAAWRSIYDCQFSLTKIDVKVDEPDYGWFDITISTPEGRSFIFSISEVYSPLQEIRSMLQGWIGRCGVMDIVIDCELYKVSLGIMPTNIYINNSGKEYGVLKCFRTRESGEHIDFEKGDDSLVAIVEINQTAMAIYSAFKTCILNSTALLNDPEEWREEELIEEYFDKKITAEEYRKELFERYLKIPCLED